MGTQKKPSLQMTNKEAVDMIAQDASPQLAKVLEPVTTQDNPTPLAFENVYTGLIADEQSMNEFIAKGNMISQQFATAVRMWSNKMAQFYRDDLLFGDTIEEIGIRSYQAHTYKVSGTPGDCFEQEPPDIVTMLHRVNHKVYYERTDNLNVIRRAFLNDGGLSRFFAANATVFMNSDQRDNFEECKKILTDNYKFANMRKIHIANPTENDTNMRALSKLIREIAIKCTFLTADYNRFELDTFTPTAELCVFITPDVDAAMIVDMLAYAYNMEKAELVGNVITIDKWDLPGTNIFICDKEAFQIHRQVFQVGTIYDPRHLCLNTFLHDQAMYSFSQFLNAVCLTTNDVDDENVTTVAVTPGATTVTKGQTEDNTAEVTGDETNAVFWKISGNTSEDTYINGNGRLYCASDEKTGTKITITAVSQKNTAISGTGTVTVE